jgi:hypothetical protein
MIIPFPLTPKPNPSKLLRIVRRVRIRIQARANAAYPPGASAGDHHVVMDPAYVHITQASIAEHAAEYQLRAQGVHSIGDDSTTRAATDAPDRVLYDQPSDWDVVEAVKQVAAARGVAPAQVALAWLLHQPTAAAPIVGATKLAHSEDALGAVALKLEASELAALQAPYKPHPVRGMSGPTPQQMGRS